MSIPSNKYDIEIECGADFALSFVIRDDGGSLVNLADAVITAQLREYAEAQDYLEFTAVHNSAGGKITLTMAHEDTANISYTQGVYDVFVTLDGTTEKVVYGDVTVYPNVTKPVEGEIMYLLSFNTEEDLPAVGMMRRVYFCHASSFMYRWNGTAYVGMNMNTYWDDIPDKPETFPPSEHTHDDRYYTETETDTLLSGKSDTGHTHDDRYYTEDEMDTLLSAKADSADLGDLASKDKVDWDTDIDDIPSTFPPESHTHDDRYYTETEIDTALSGKSDTSHTHDDRYYTQTETDALLGEKADIIHSSASGALVHITDAGAYPVDSLTVGIEPVQDLHGQSAPYPPGGGKNLFHVTATSETLNDVIFTVNSDGSVKANGTPSANSNFVLGTMTIEAGTYYLNGLPSSNNNILLQITNENQTEQLYTTVVHPNDELMTFTETTTIVMRFRIVAGTNVNNVTAYPMIRPSSVSDATFAPYSNVCPISGHNSAVVTRTGRNLLHLTDNTLTRNNITFTTTSSDGSVTAYSTGALATQSFEIGRINVKAGSYSLNGLTGGSSSTYRIRIRDNNDVNNYAYCSNGEDATITVGKDTELLIQLFVYEGATIDKTFYPMVRLASVSDATYEPYSGTQVTIDLDGTRYGGQLNVLTGELMMDRAYHSFDGSETIGTYGGGDLTLPLYQPSASGVENGEIISSMLKGVTTYAGIMNNAGTIRIVSNGIAIHVNSTFQGSGWNQSQFQTYLASLNTAGTPLQICYQLATPVTVTGLTPATLSLLLGENNIWSDTGSVDVGYRANTKLYIDSKLASAVAELQALILENS